MPLPEEIEKASGDDVLVYEWIEPLSKLKRGHPPNTVDRYPFLSFRRIS